MASVLSKVLNKIFPNKQARRVKPWVAAKGDKTLRLNYDLDKTSIVFDLGGYEGQWASDIFSKYLSRVYVFEPYKEYAGRIRDRFKGNSNIEVFDFGLGKSDQKMMLFSSDDGSSVFKKTDNSFEIEIKKASEFINKIGVEGIDLMKINIEGGEYDLLEELLSQGSVLKIKNIQVQFHDFVPDSLNRMTNIQNQLSKTHRLTYQYQFVWENWQII